MTISFEFCNNDDNEKKKEKGTELQEIDFAKEAASDRFEASTRLEKRLIKTTAKI